jgi:hypothetical protein
MVGVVAVSASEMPLIPSLVLPRTGSVGRARQAGATPSHRVPVPRLPVLRERSSVYGLSSIDDRGRVAAHHVLGQLGWAPGTPVAIAAQGGLVVVTVDESSGVRILPRGHLRVPAPIRRWCDLTPGTRVLLVADPVPSRLVIHSLASLDLMVSRRHADVLGGEA